MEERLLKSPEVVAWVLLSTQSHARMPNQLGEESSSPSCLPCAVPGIYRRKRTESSMTRKVWL